MKDANIQLLRALAIIAVVFIHTCPHGMEQVIFRPFINFAVPLFLFLSGYLTTPKARVKSRKITSSPTSLYHHKIITAPLPEGRYESCYLTLLV
ncbi:MAG: acyltransferase [Akkermansiaceae bacterium]|nr:acyltransferase [Akkermansiaceae bacterium]